MDTLFAEIAIVIIAAGALSLIFSVMRQPMIIAYIVTGLLIGPSVLGFAGDGEVFGTMSEIGIAFLLFLVGLNLNWRNIKDVGKIATLAGFAQVIFTAGLGFLILRYLNFDISTSILIGIALSFSSTIIIVKLLSDKEDLDRFYGRIAVGILIVQDLVAMLALLVIGAFGEGGMSIQTILATSAIKAVGVIAILYLIARFVLPHVFSFAAKSQELLFLTAISWCFALASILLFLGFGIEIGALLAGLTLAGSQFHREIESKIRPLRDFFLVIFFIVLGTQLVIEDFRAMIVPSIILIVFVLIINPIIVLAVLRSFHYHPRTGFLVGITMAQVSEFSFILAAGGISAGLVDATVLPLITIVGMITIGISTYLIKYNEQIYKKTEWAFRWLEHKRAPVESKNNISTEIILIGYEHLGQAILPSIKKLKQTYLVVDFDPSAIKELEDLRIPCEYGDAGNEEFLHHILAEKAKVLISTIPDFAVSSDLIEYTKLKRSRGAVIVTAKSAQQASRLYELGATFVILPNALGGELFADMLKKKGNKKQSWNAASKKYQKQFKSC